MATTFDSSAQGNLPPPELLNPCKEMDQVWLTTGGERDTFLSAGIPAEKIQLVYWPHPWLGNAVVPPPIPEALPGDGRFRFLSIAMFLPRRRWDTLIEAYLEEFKQTENVELYLKVNYPSWHPVPGKPRQDLFDLVASLRRKTGSEASIIVDEDIGTRKGIVQLIDGCNVYISTDTSLTAPINEARVRERMVIIPDDLGFGAPHDWFVPIRVDPNAKTPMTREMLSYQPYHKSAFMPLLHGEDVRRALREAYEMTLAERRAVAAGAANLPGPAQAVPGIINAILAGWQEKRKMKETLRPSEMTVVWEGSQFVHHSLALINRELCLELIDAGHELSILPYERHAFGEKADPRFEKLSACFHKKFERPADVHVRHRWPPDFTPPPEGHWVMIQPWEYGSLPVEWVRKISAGVDEIWVPSHYVRNGYIRSGVPADRVFVVPNGVNTELFNSAAPAYPLQTKKAFKFLFVGGTISRKGIDILLDVYTRSFSSKDDVCLVVKDMGGESFYRGQTAKEWIRRLQAEKDKPEIEYIGPTLSEREMAGLYTACNCLVHPYRGEGFGLPILEAMACGTPVVVTGHGAALDFCNEATAFLIPARDVTLPVKRVGNYETVDFPRLAEPDKQHLAQLMQKVFLNKPAALSKAAVAVEFVKSNFTWAHSAQVVETRIHELRRKPILRRRLHPDSQKELTGPAPEAIIPKTNAAGTPTLGPDQPVPPTALHEACGGLPTGGHEMSVIEEMYAAMQPVFQACRSDAAEQGLQNILRVFPDFARAHHDLASLLYRTGRKQEALRHYEQAAAAAPDEADFQKMLGDYYYVESARIEDALRLYRKVLQLRPADVQTLMTVGNILASLQRFDEADRHYRRVLAVDPMHAEAAENHRKLSGRKRCGQEPAGNAEEMHAEAQRLAEAGRAAEACERLECLLAGFPHFAAAHNDLAVLSYHQGNKSHALRHYEAAVRLQSENLTFHKNLADFYLVEQGRVEEALGLYVKVLESDPKDIETLTALGKACTLLRQKDDARVFYERVLEIEPWNSVAREGLNQLADAEPGAAQLLNAQETHAEAVRLASSGDRSGASQLLERLLETSPEFALAHNDLGVLAYQAGDKRKALAYYESAARLAPQDATCRKNLADCYWVGFGRTEEALKVYVDILTTHPKDVETLIATGKLCQSVGQPDDARVFFERVLEIEPSNTEARTQLEQAAAASQAA
jgi:glycosyltransferase involved in cell wall biosynthesis/tetratricopeptide (TPR) repeat protein